MEDSAWPRCCETLNFGEGNSLPSLIRWLGSVLWANKIMSAQANSLRPSYGLFPLSWPVFSIVDLQRPSFVSVRQLFYNIGSRLLEKLGETSICAEKNCVNEHWCVWTLCCWAPSCVRVSLHWSVSALSNLQICWMPFWLLFYKKLHFTSERPLIIGNDRCLSSLN